MQRLALATLLGGLALGTSARAASSDVLLGASPRGMPAWSQAAIDDADGLLWLVIDTPYEIWSGQGSYVHVVAYGPDFKPVRGAHIYANRRPVGTTDAQGTLVFRHVPRPEPAAPQADGETFDGFVVITGVYSTKGRRYVGEVEFESYARTSGFESTQLYVYTDRGVYQPGDTIHVRAIAWRLRDNYRPLEGERITLRLRDDAGRLLSTGAVRTSRYGTASFDFPTPRSTPEGRYRLFVHYEGEEESTRLRFERVVAPAIKIEHSLPRVISRDRTQLEFDVRLGAFVGPAPKAGELRVEVRLGKNLLHSQTRTLDGRPSYAFGWDADLLSRLRAAAPDDSVVVVEMIATDASKRTDRVRREITFSDRPYEAIVEADKENYAIGDRATVSVKLTDLDGVPVRGKSVRLALSVGMAPAPKPTDDHGVAWFSVALEQERVTIDAWVDDVARAVGTLEVYAEARRPIASTITTPVVKEGGSVPLEVSLQDGFTPLEAVVHGDVVDSSGALVTAFTLPLQRASAGFVARGQFTAPIWGSMLITLYCAARDARGDVGLLTEGQEVTVHPHQALSIALDGLPRTARPGERLMVRARVTDVRGKPRDAAVGASVVDAAMLSLLDPLEILPADRFYNPERKVLATTGGKLLTWPVVSRNWGSHRRDVALPPFGYVEGELFTDLMQQNAERQREAQARRARAKSGATGALDDVQDGGMMGQGIGSASGGVGYGAVGSGVALGSSSPPPVVITVRTRFDDTSLWLPDLVTQNGAIAFELGLPDSITQQAITLVASDRAGGVGVLRHDLTVSQPLSVRSDLPARLRRDETLTVYVAARNLTDQTVRGSVRLQSAGLEIAPPVQPIEIPPQSTASAPFTVRATSLGDLAYEVSVQTDTVQDTEQRTVFVEPLGVPVVTSQNGRAARKAPYRAHFVTDAGSSARVSITFSGAGRAMRELVDLLADAASEPAMAWEVPGTEAALAYHLAALLQRYERLNEAIATRLRGIIARDLLRIALAWKPGEGARFFRTATVSPYLTGRALEGLNAARAADFPVEDERIAEAGGAILSHLDPQGLVATQDIAWWEGGGPERRLALTAELFRILAEAGPTAIPAARARAFAAMRERVAASINTTSDPLTLANAALGQLAHTAHFGGPAVSPQIAERWLRRLLESRTRGHWEPSWFHAEGGSVQATAAALELLPLLDPATAAQLGPELLEALRSFRTRLGRWHHGAASIAVLRALGALPLEAVDSQKATVTVRLDGRAVKSFTLEPRGDLDDLLALQSLDLTPSLAPGEHDLVVETTGVSEPWVELAVQRFEQTPASPLPLERRVSPSSARVGDEITLTLALPAVTFAGGAALREPLPPHVEAIESALDEHVRAGRLLDYRTAPKLELLLPSGAARTLPLKLRAVRAGRAVFGGAELHPLARPEETRPAGGSTALTIAP